MDTVAGPESSRLSCCMLLLLVVRGFGASVPGGESDGVRLFVLLCVGIMGEGGGVLVGVVGPFLKKDPHLVFLAETELDRSFNGLA